MDKFADCAPDAVVDLESFPWPWPNDSADEIVLSHVLEHLGAETVGYFNVFRELYRVCRHGAVLDITVPHPRHDLFLADPTHVRAITIGGLSMFSRRQCEIWIRDGNANTPIALMVGVDFEIAGYTFMLEPEWKRRYELGELNDQEMARAIRELSNVVVETNVLMRAVKRYDV